MKYGSCDFINLYTYYICKILYNRNISTIVYYALIVVSDNIELWVSSTMYSLHHTE